MTVIVIGTANIPVIIDVAVEQANLPSDADIELFDPNNLKITPMAANSSAAHFVVHQSAQNAVYALYITSNPQGQGAVNAGLNISQPGTPLKHVVDETGAPLTQPVPINNLPSTQAVRTGIAVTLL